MEQSKVNVKLNINVRLCVVAAVCLDIAPVHVCTQINVDESSKKKNVLKVSVSGRSSRVGEKRKKQVVKSSESNKLLTIR